MAYRSLMVSIGLAGWSYLLRPRRGRPCWLKYMRASRLYAGSKYLFDNKNLWDWRAGVMNATYPAPEDHGQCPSCFTNHVADPILGQRGCWHFSIHGLDVCPTQVLE